MFVEMEKLITLGKLYGDDGAFGGFSGTVGTDNCEIPSCVGY